MDKQKCAERFASKYAKLNEGERDDFARIANKLLSSSFLCEAKETDRNDYYDTQHHFSMYEDYFAILEYELILHGAEKAIQLKSRERYNHRNLKLNESILLLLLRKLYALKAKELTLHENVIVSIEEVHDAILDTGYLSRRMAKTEFREIIRLFKRFSLIDNIGDIEKDDSMLVLYPSIVYAAPYEELTELSSRIRAYCGEEEERETSDEDSSD